MIAQNVKIFDELLPDYKIVESNNSGWTCTVSNESNLTCTEKDRNMSVGAVENLDHQGHCTTY